ncbi:efflux RND transporter permease subunit, partial [Staphylococcus aureus]
ALCATMLKPIDHHKKQRGPGAWFNRGFGKTTDGYVSSIGYLLKRPLRVMIIFAIVIGGCVWFFSKLPSSFLPQEDQGVLLTIIQTPTG